MEKYNAWRAISKKWTNSSSGGRILTAGLATALSMTRAACPFYLPRILQSNQRRNLRVTPKNSNKKGRIWAITDGFDKE